MSDFDPTDDPFERALSAWKRDDDVPDFAAAVVARLRAERPSPPPARHWAHVGWAGLAAALLVAAAVALTDDEQPASTMVADGTQTPAPDGSDETAPPPEVAPAPAPPSTDAVAFEEASPPPAPTLVRQDEALPRDLFTSERLSAAWEILPDPNRTWRDEVRDGVRPFRDGADVVVSLFTQALPPPPRRPY